jgi:hypothetical protein
MSFFVTLARRVSGKSRRIGLARKNGSTKKRIDQVASVTGRPWNGRQLGEAASGIGLGAIRIEGGRLLPPV